VKPKIEPDRVANNVGREAMTVVGDPLHPYPSAPERRRFADELVLIQTRNEVQRAQRGIDLDALRPTLLARADKVIQALRAAYPGDADLDERPLIHARVDRLVPQGACDYQCAIGAPRRLAAVVSSVGHVWRGRLRW
jgi:hypothetical protein